MSDIIRKPSHGEIRAIEGRLQDVVRNGDPDTGWEGDPYLTVEYEPQTERLIVWDMVMNPPSLVLAKPYDGVAALDTRSLTARLKAAQHKGQGFETIWNRMEARERAAEEERAQRRIAYGREQAELLAELYRRVDWG